MHPLGSLIPAVILDWAGTMIDHGCMAPVAALQSVFAQHGLTLAASEARQGMGLPKKIHLQALLTSMRSLLPVDQLYPELEQAIFRALGDHSKLIRGAADFAEWLRAGKIRIGTTTGYTSAMMGIVAKAAAEQGYVPDAMVTPDQVAMGRPAPLMMYANAARLGVWPLWNVVKIGDTPADVAEARNAGAWSIGVTLSGNALGLSPDEMERLEAGPREASFAAARISLLDARPDYIVDSVAECPAVLAEIAGRIRAGERPVS